MLYRGIDAVFHGRGGRVEYDFEIAAGADPAQIALALPAKATAVVDGEGSLAVRVAGHVYRQLAPQAWQEGRDGRVPVAVEFVVTNNVVRFHVGPYDRRLPLTIDPALDYSSYLGKANGISMASDPAGNVYLAMSTYAAAFPNTVIGTTARDSIDVLVAKFDPTGRSLIYATLIGGSREEQVTRLVVNAAGEVYVVGQTFSVDFPQVRPVAANRASVFQEGFAFRLAADGRSLVYSTILVGIGTTMTYDAAVAGDGSLLVAASTNAGLWFPAASVYAPGGRTDQMGLCLKIGPTGGSYQYASAVSGSDRSTTVVKGVAVDSGGRVVWLVETNSPAITPVGGGVGKTSSGLQGMLLEWNAAGSAPVFLTTLFPGADWQIRRIRFAPDRSLLLLGFTSGDQPIPPGEKNVGNSEQRGPFFVQLSADTRRLLLRNSLDFLATEVAVDGAGNLILAGEASTAAIFDAYQPSDPDSAGTFVRKYGSNWQEVIYGTFLGGSREERLGGMTVDAEGRVWLAGTTRSADFPTTLSVGAAPEAFSGEIYGFLSRFRDTTGSIGHTFTSQPSGMEVWIDGTAYVTPARFVWQPGTVHSIWIRAASVPGGKYPDAHYFDDARWDHGGALEQTITASASPRSYGFSYTRRPCGFAVSPLRFEIGTAGGVVIPQITTHPQCLWDPESQVPWMRFQSYRNAGSGPLIMGVNASPKGTYRRGTFSVAGIPVVVEQGGVAPNPESLTMEQISEDARERRVTGRFFDGDGHEDLGVVNILINSALDGNKACYLAFDSVSDTMYLVNDDNTNLVATGLSSLTPIENGQCSVRNVGAERSGNVLTVTMVIRFKSAFQGDKIGFLAARDRTGGNSGWSPREVIRLSETTAENTRPQVMSHTQPEAGRIRVVYRDAVAAGNITALQLLINGELNGAGACYVGYDAAANVMYLLDDAGTGLLLPGITPGGAGTVANQRCTLDGASSSRTLSGRDLALTYGLTLKPGFQGHLVYFAGIQSKSPGLANSGWRYLRYLNRTQ
ncbi:MAG: hypothetical protein ACK58M_13430 [Acidobacteriota bacterium]